MLLAITAYIFTVAMIVSYQIICYKQHKLELDVKMFIKRSINTYASKAFAAD